MQQITGMVLALLLTGVLASDSDATPDTYIAAVFEHARVGDIATESLYIIAKKNLDVYATAAEEASKRGADIIVFPDYGLIPKLKDRKVNKEVLESIPSPDDSDPPQPCEQPQHYYERPILISLSCLARDNKIVIVAGMGGIVPCSSDEDSKCPPDGAYHLNANVAFDKNGTLIARYYKEHLFFEPAYNVPPVSQSSVFKTDFGKFALFSSFDILYNNSVDVLQQNSGVENVVFPTLWFDELPFLSSIQVQEMFAVRMGVNVLAANLNIPRREALGSGIYSCGLGAVRYTYNPDELSKLLIAKIPRKPGIEIFEEQQPILVIKDNKVSEYQVEDGCDVPDICSAKVLGPSDTEYRCNERDFSKFSLMKLVKPEDSIQTCSNTTCCKLEYKIAGDSFAEDYYLAAFDGDMTIKNRYSLSIETCTLVRCDSIEGKECATFPLKSQTVFEEFCLGGDFRTPFVFPSVVQSQQRLLPASKFQFSLHKGEGMLKSSNVSKPLLVASLFGRCYDNDPPYDQ